jgi:SAM-dependent methyltransferase
MLSSFPCPVCSESAWKPIDTFRYGRSDEIPRSLGTSRDYILLRRRIMFEVWFPDAKTITLRSVMCCGCGFMAYAPRPSEEDIDAKYRFLQATEKDIGGQGPSAKAKSADRRRATRVYRTMARHLASGRISLLDFGGGNGKLLAPFLKRGHSCVLVDYTQEPLPGIEKIGDTLEDVPSDRTFDAIICSHVLEHVAEPAQVLRRLSDHLTAGGVIYGEVPAECWRGIEIGLDPVTHVNFFTPSSFLELFARQDLDVLAGRRIVGTYGQGRMDVVFVVARKGATNRRPGPRTGVREAERLLNPSSWMELQRRLRLRKLPTVGGLLRRLRSVMGSAGR